MSLDVYLHKPSLNRSSSGSGIFVRENGSTREISREEWDSKFPDREPVVALLERDDEAFAANITHNLTTMADAAGIHQHLWRPDEIGITTAAQLIEPLRDGLARLLADPDKFKAFNPRNGWGSYEGLLEFVCAYLQACEQDPDAIVSASR